MTIPAPALSPTISDAPAAWPAGDWNTLRAAGLAYVEQFAHQLWTDYNRHDPGITTLELLCYAITDLSQRTAVDVPDVLRTTYGSDADMVASLLPAHEVFPTSPVTLLDYRKLLLDIPGVRNAWLVKNTADGTVFINSTDPSADPDLRRKRNGDLSGAPGNYTYAPVRGGAPGPLYSLQGLYDIFVELDPDVASTEADQARLLEQVRTTYLNQRNLGEDLVGVKVVESLSVGVQARINLSPEADPAAVHAQLLLAIDQHLAPAVKRYSLAEMQALTGPDGQPLTLDQIYEGPRLTRGFIREAELGRSELRRSIHASDLIALAMEIPGVSAVSGLKMSGVPAGSTTDMDTTLAPSTGTDPWTMTLNPGLYPRLELRVDAPTEIRFYRNGTEVSNYTTTTAALRTFEQLKQELLAAKARSVPAIPVPLGMPRDLQSYQPLALDFPATYGIGPAGLPADAPAERRHQARQLQAYLLFFDQLLANYLAQLMHVKDLLTTAPATGPTYFGQRLNSALLPELRELYNAELRQTDLSVALATTDATPTDTDRHNRFADHLLARFGESFAEYGLLVYNAQPVPPASELTHKTGLAQDLLKYHPARGFGYHLPSWQGDPNPPEAVGPDRSPYDASVIAGPTRSSAKGVASDTNDKIARDNVAAIARRFGRLVGMPEADFIGHWSLRRGTPPNVRIYSSQGWRDVVATLPRKETILVVEHALLRPLPGYGVEWLEAGIAGRTPGDLLDPYSYQVTILLPGEAPRFADPLFRRNAETLLRAELPAHVLPHICWISAAHLAEFESYYNAWLYYKRSIRLDESTPGQIQNLLTWQSFVVSLLNDFHSIYLPQEFPGKPGYSIAFEAESFEASSFF